MYLVIYTILVDRNWRKPIDNHVIRFLIGLTSRFFISNFKILESFFHVQVTNYEKNLMCAKLAFRGLMTHHGVTIHGHYNKYFLTMLHLVSPELLDHLVFMIYSAGTFFFTFILITQRKILFQIDPGSWIIPIKYQFK